MLYCVKSNEIRPGPCLKGDKCLSSPFTDKEEGNQTQENNCEQIKAYALCNNSSRVLLFQNGVQKELNKSLERSIYSVFWGMLEEEMLNCRRKEIPG